MPDRNIVDCRLFSSYWLLRVHSSTLVAILCLKYIVVSKIPPRSVQGFLQTLFQRQPLLVDKVSISILIVWPYLSYALLHTSEKLLFGVVDAHGNLLASSLWRLSCRFQPQGLEDNTQRHPSCCMHDITE